MKLNKKITCYTLIILSFFCNSVVSVSAAPKPELWPFWETNDPKSTLSVDHSVWDNLLKRYVDESHPSGINRFKYSLVTKADTQNLKQYLQNLQRTKVTALKRSEQKAYWINLYNALTVKTILDHYPVKSIKDVDISPGWFNDGPWDAVLLKIEDKSVTLNDIEHRILRPIWQDNRVHYALNCASLGCPNLLPAAFTSSTAEGLLEKATHNFINHPRGVQFQNGILQLSSIYKWFQVDFGGSEKQVVQHLLKYADPELSKVLEMYNHQLRYDYDWNLNE